MSTYTVKTIDDRNLVIEADSLKFGSNGSEDYVFHADGKVVALVPRHNVFAISADKADKADYYYSDHELDDRYNPDFGEFLESEAFFDAVVGVLDVTLEPDDDAPLLPAPDAADPEPKIEQRYVSTREATEWGFETPSGWVGFGGGSSKDVAESGLKSYLNGARGWLYDNIEDAEVIQ